MDRIAYHNETALSSLQSNADTRWILWIATKMDAFWVADRIAIRLIEIGWSDSDQLMILKPFY